MSAVNQLIGTLVHILQPPERHRDERGLSQSTENAILLAGAVAVAVIVIAAITTYVQANLPT
ncbi:hypothetical protein GCM10028820_31580 [Tessaracoccus terricola]